MEVFGFVMKNYTADIAMKLHRLLTRLPSATLLAVRRPLACLLFLTIIAGSLSHVLRLEGWVTRSTGNAQPIKSQSARRGCLPTNDQVRGSCCRSPRSYCCAQDGTTAGLLERSVVADSTAMPKLVPPDQALLRRLRKRRGGHDLGWSARTNLRNTIGPS